MQSLCIHEMIVRAFKHILQAVISAVEDAEKMAVSIAAALNLMLGIPESDKLNKSCDVHSLVWRWLEVFLRKRYEWDLNNFNYRDVRKFAILRGLCHKVFCILYSLKTLSEGVRKKFKNRCMTVGCYQQPLWQTLDFQLQRSLHVKYLAIKGFLTLLFPFTLFSYSMYLGWN